MAVFNRRSHYHRCWTGLSFVPPVSISSIHDTQRDEKAKIARRKFPHQYKKKKSKWLTEDELDYARLRVKYASGPDPPTYTFRWSDVTAAAKDRKTYLMCMLFWWGGSVPTYSLSYTLPTMVKNLGYTAVKAQALTTPPYIFATCVCVFTGWISDRYQKRFFSIMGAYTLGLM